MKLLDEFKFFVPRILEDDELISMWNEDMNSLRDNYPQGMYISINESGTYFDFISKITERICGHAQLEIMRVSKELLKKYIYGSKDVAPEIHDILLQYDKGPKCTFPNIRCQAVCPFTSKLALDRVV